MSHRSSMPNTTNAASRANSSIAASLLALVLAVSVPLVVFAAYLIHRNTAQSGDLAVASALAMARNVAAATDEFLASSRSAVPQLARKVLVTRDGHLVCDPLLPEFQALMPRFPNVTVFDTRGELACSVLPAERDGFRATSADPWFQIPVTEGVSVLSAPRFGRITKKWISTYSHPIGGPDSEVSGVIMISIDLVDFHPVSRQAALSPGAIAGIIHADGTIVSRSHEAEKWIGKPAPMLLEKAAKAEGGTRHVRTIGIDGVERLYALAPIADTPWIAFAGLEMKALLAEERRNLAVLASFAGIIMIVAASAAFVFARRISEPMRGMAEAARALAAGDGQPRAPVSGPRELRAVSTEFNRMVESRQQAEAELRELAHRARELAERLTAVEQAERVRISRELHDRIGQNLAILGLNLDIAGAQLPDSTCAEAKTRLGEARAMLQTTMAHVRNVMAELRPPALDEYGLAAALRAYIASFSASTGLAVLFDGQDLSPRLASLTETGLFRIAQEALTNAAKHARAQSARVRLSDSATTVTMSISDDGSGFDGSKPNPAPTSWGLTTMRERAEAMGARLRIESRAGHGTTVIVEVDR